MPIRLVNARNKYGDFWTHGPMPLSPFFKIRTRNFERLNYERPVVRKIPCGEYDLLIDVGAGWGYHTIIAAHRMPHVIAIESNALRYGLLLWNTQTLKNVERLWAFVGREGQRARRAASPAKPVELGQPEIDNSAVTLDSVAEASSHYPPKSGRTVVKIDVEGGELDVLTGAPDLLQDKTVDWIVELHKRCFGITEATLDEFMDGKEKTQLSEKHYLYRSCA